MFDEIISDSIFYFMYKFLLVVTIIPKLFNLPILSMRYIII